MVRQCCRFALVAGALLFGTAAAVRAGDNAPCAPATQTVCCTEYVPQTYQCTRTVYKTVCKQEEYTTFKCECYPETRTRTVTVCKMVPEVQTVVRQVCVCVPCVEQRTVMQTCVSYKPVTTVCRKCVDRGHYECREVPCGPSCWDRIKACFHKNDCCCEPCCVKTKTVKVWVPCPVWVETPVTKCVRVCEQKPVVVQCCTCKRVLREERCQVTVCKPVHEQKVETYTVLCTRQVPCKAVRTVRVCVPCQETVTCCRMVARTVTKQVPVVPCCHTCCTPCCPSCCGKASRCGR